MSYLVVEDNPVQALMLQRALKEREFDVEVARDGEEALHLGNMSRYEVILLDLELPKVDGLTVLRSLRTAGVRVPVVVLSCHETVAERVEALQAGADDYMCKPFHLDELMARIRALLRRPLPERLKLKVADLELDCVERTVKRGNTPIHLGAKEYSVLEFLMRNAGGPVTRAAVVQHVWNSQSTALVNIVDVYISFLRRKVDFGFETPLIRTVRGVGYAIVDPAAPTS